MELNLSNKYLTGKPFTEHHQFYFNNETISLEDLSFYENEIYFRGNKSNETCCFKIENQKAFTSYFIGIDWLSKRKDKAIYIQPKVNEGKYQLDYIKMLFSLTNHPQILDELNSVYEIKWNDDYIEIEDYQDHLTPLLVVQFLQIMKQIVRKGLKKSYYKVESNLYARIKGKVLVASTIKNNLFKNKQLNTVCRFDEFGVNGTENRLLKKALLFSQRYVNFHKLNTDAGITSLFNYILPAFADVDDDVNLFEVKHSINNGIYKDYASGSNLAKLLLKRFGYNINNTQTNNFIKTPPFWIDMSKLFELYVLALLKEQFNNDVLFQVSSNKETYYGKPDFLLKKKGFESIIDSKYKIQYQADNLSFNEYLIKDIRQLSGYARDNRIIDLLNRTGQDIIECLIIYPDLNYLDKNEKPKLNLGDKKEIYQFNKFYKLGVKLPFFSSK